MLLHRVSHHASTPTPSRGYRATGAAGELAHRLIPRDWSTIERFASTGRMLIGLHDRRSSEHHVHGPSGRQAGTLGARTEEFGDCHMVTPTSSRPLVSVVLGSYNRHPFLEQ